MPKGTSESREISTLFCQRSKCTPCNHLCTLTLVAWKQNTQVSEVKEFRKVFHNLSPTPIKTITTRIWAYRGDMQNPRWKDVDTGRLHTPLVVHFRSLQSPRKLHKSMWHHRESFPFTSTGKERTQRRYVSWDWIWHCADAWTYRV